MKADIHPKYQAAEMRCACGNVVQTRSTKPVILVGICNVCHPSTPATRSSSIPPGAWTNSSSAWPKPTPSGPPSRRKGKRSSRLCPPPPAEGCSFAGGLLFYHIMDLRPYIERYARRLAEVEA